MQSLKRIYQNTSIKLKWIIFVLVLALYPMILIGYVGYSNYEQMITEHFIKSVQKDVDVVGMQLEERLNDIEKFIKQIQYDGQIFDISSLYYDILDEERKKYEGMLEGELLEKRYQQAIMNNYTLNVKVGKHLKSLLLSRPEIDVGGFTFTKSGEFGFIEVKDVSKKLQDYTCFERNKVFMNIENEFTEDNSTAYYIDGEANIYIGQKLYYRYTGEHFGTAIFRLDMDYLLGNHVEMLEDAKEAVYVMATTKFAQADLLSIGNLEQDKKNKLEDFIATNPKKGILYKEETSTRSVIYRVLESENLLIGNAVYISNTILLEEMRTMSRFMFMLCLTILPLFLLIANRLYKEIVYPVYILSDKMQQIEQGQLGKQIKVDRSDEFGYLFASFNRMSKRLQYLVNCVYKEQIALKSAEIKSLQAQINPHFLYNTLEMINWKARMSGNEDIAEMLEALGGILEINIDRRSSPFLTIEEELDYIRNYVFLIQKRFGERIVFKEYVQEHLFEYKIPRLLLQPLVENAIGHGIEPVGQGCIEVHVVDAGEDLEICIRDDGKGISEERLKQLQQQLENNNSGFIENEDDGKGHIGIINGQRRVQLLYGENYGIQLKSKVDEGTEIMIRLPKTIEGYHT